MVGEVGGVEEGSPNNHLEVGLDALGEFEGEVGFADAAFAEFEGDGGFADAAKADDGDEAAAIGEDPAGEGGEFGLASEEDGDVGGFTPVDQLGGGIGGLAGALEDGAAVGFGDGFLEGLAEAFPEVGADFADMFDGFSGGTGDRFVILVLERSLEDGDLEIAEVVSGGVVVGAIGCLDQEF